MFNTLISLILLRSAWQDFNFTVIILHAFEHCHVTKEQVRAHQEGISLSILYLNIDGCSLFILLRTKLVLLGWGIINLIVLLVKERWQWLLAWKSPSFAILHSEKKKKNLQFEANSVSDHKEKNGNCAMALSRQVKAEAYWLSWCSLPPTSAPRIYLL